MPRIASKWIPHGMDALRFSVNGWEKRRFAGFFYFPAALRPVGGKSRDFFDENRGKMYRMKVFFAIPANLKEKILQKQRKYSIMKD